MSKKKIRDLKEQEEVMRMEHAALRQQIIQCRNEVMQMAYDTPFLAEALIALGYDEDGLKCLKK